MSAAGSQRPTPASLRLEDVDQPIPVFRILGARGIVAAKREPKLIGGKRGQCRPPRLWWR